MISSSVRYFSLSVRLEKRGCNKCGPLGQYESLYSSLPFFFLFLSCPFFQQALKFKCKNGPMLRFNICKETSAGVRLQGDWGEIVALEGSKSPWEALRATKTSPSIFATFEKANTCAKRTFLLGEIQGKLNKHAKVKFF